MRHADARATTSPRDTSRHPPSPQPPHLAQTASAMHDPSLPYSGTYPDGTSLFIEQASHHPPVSAWQMEDARQRYRFDGIANYEASTKPNSVRARQLGENRLHFASGEDGAGVPALGCTLACVGSPAARRLSQRSTPSLVRPSHVKRCGFPPMPSHWLGTRPRRRRRGDVGAAGVVRAQRHVRGDAPQGEHGRNM